MNKIILISWVLMLGWASQAIAIPIVSQRDNPDAKAVQMDTLLPYAPFIHLTYAPYEKASSSFAEFVTAFTSNGERGNRMLQASNRWWDHNGKRDGDWGERGPNGSLFGAGSANPNPSNSVPEPATMLLFGTGLIGLALISRKGLK